jgi:IS1 family transposase
MNKTSDTPLTDAAVFVMMPGVGILPNSKPVEFLRPDFARRLERERGELIEALHELSAMYASTWDRVDESLVMMGDGVKRFEKAHSKARALLARLKEPS